MEAITAAVGKNGSGKSLALVERVVVPSLKMGRPILSNMTIFASTADRHLPSDERERHPLWTPLVSPAQLVGLESTTVVVDEIQSAFSSRESGKMPAQTVNDLLQLRKDDNVLAWSGPSWMRADIAIREVTLEVILCTGHLGRRIEGRIWRANRLFRYRYFDAQDFEEFNVASAKSEMAHSLKPASRKWYLRSRHEACWLYDTHQHVETFTHLDEYGTCSRCHGSRRRPPCSCARYMDEGPSAGGPKAPGAGAAHLATVQYNPDHLPVNGQGEGSLIRPETGGPTGRS